MTQDLLRARWWLASLLLLAALVMLRAQLAVALGFDLNTAVANRLWAGWLYDAALVATLALVARVAGLLRPAVKVWAVLATLAWLSALANVLHFRFFGVRLDLWVIRVHWRDLGLIEGSAIDLGSTWQVGASAILWLGAVVAAVFVGAKQKTCGGRDAENPSCLGDRANKSTEADTLSRPLVRQWASWTTTVWRRSRAILALFLLSLVLWRLPDWAEPEETGMILSDQILRVWWYELTRERMHHGVSTKWMQRLTEAESQAVSSDAPAVVAQYRDGLEPGVSSHEGEAGPAAIGMGGTGRPKAGMDLVVPDAAWPLDAQLQANPEETRALRQRLGLPLAGPVHLVLVLVESWRAYELFHPDLGPIIFPRLRALLAARALVFTQAYSSSFAAGQTVRGQLSTLCSMLPNMAGAATYLAHTTVRLHCLQSLAARHGYHVAWLSGFSSTFHSSRQFESLHGTTLFFDESYFSGRGVKETLGDWGLADGPMLAESRRTLEDLAATGQPVLANILTLSSHHPHTVLPDYPLPDALSAATQEDPAYQGYLSRLSYVDGAVASFVEALLAGPLGERAVVFLLGDHSLALRPPGELSWIRQAELAFRIPIALLTKRLPTPASLAYPVHQIDIAPTAARIAGLAGPVSFVGRGLFPGLGSPWVYPHCGQLAYRAAERGCYPLPRGPGLRCYDLTGLDPLWATDLPEIPEIGEQSDFYRRLIQANFHTIALNRAVAPEKTDAD